MTKPDRFARVVERAIGGCRGRYRDLLTRHETETLLARQFVAIRRMVVRQPVAKHAIALISRKDLLAALDAWAKGGR